MDGGVWKGWIWSISLGDNYFEALQALVTYRCRQGSPALNLLIPLRSFTPSSRLISRAESEICRIREGLAATARLNLRFPEQGRDLNRAERMGKMLTAQFGVSIDGCRDFMLAFGRYRFLNCDQGRMSTSIANIVQGERKVLHSCKLLYAAFGRLPEKRGKDVAPTCDQVQVAVVKGEMKATPDHVDEDAPAGWPVEGSEVIVLDAPSSTLYRIGYEDMVVELPRKLIKITPVRLRYNPTLHHLSLGYSRVEIEKDGTVHTALRELIPLVIGEMHLPKDYDGWPSDS